MKIPVNESGQGSRLDVTQKLYKSIWAMFNDNQSIPSLSHTAINQNNAYNASHVNIKESLKSTLNHNYSQSTNLVHVAEKIAMDSLD